MAGTSEYQVLGPTKTEEMESQYTGCHSHGTETCVHLIMTSRLTLLILGSDFATSQMAMKSNFS
jgi:hypothetical protein